MKEMKALEKEREAREKDEAALAASMQNTKKKLLDDLAKEDAKQVDAVRKLQEMKEKEKETLVSSLSNGKCIKKLEALWHLHS